MEQLNQLCAHVCSLELEWVAPVVLKHSHDLLAHPLHLRLGKLHNIVAHIVEQCNRVGTQT